MIRSGLVTILFIQLVFFESESKNTLTIFNSSYIKVKDSKTSIHENEYKRKPELNTEQSILDSHSIKTDDNRNRMDQISTRTKQMDLEKTSSLEFDSQSSLPSNISSVFDNFTFVDLPSMNIDQQEANIDYNNFNSTDEDLGTENESSDFFSSNYNGSSNKSYERECRSRDGRYLPPQFFTWDSCALCYHYETSKRRIVKPLWNLVARNFKIFDKFLTLHFLSNASLNSSHPMNSIFIAEPTNDTLFLSISNLRFRQNWMECCLAAQRCCASMVNHQTPAKSDNMTTECPRTWDGWQCWNDSKPDTNVQVLCPSYAYIDTHTTCTKMAVKYCDSGGSWLKRKDKEWTDYRPCGVTVHIRQRIFYHLCALSLSVMALTPALLIFFCFRQLKVHRITLHKHLFLSLLLEACCSIFFRLLELNNIETISEESPVWCVTLSMVRRYARQSNYMWYLCEGFYLHKLLASAFAEQRSLALFYYIGWGFPLIPIIIYGLIRGAWYGNSHCWSIPENGIEWILYLPPLFALLINFLFVINIVRILLGKVRSRFEHEPCQYRMAVRATLMVIPLFGLQYIVTIYRPKGQSCDWLDIYHIINSIIDGSTGFIVAIIFCFANGEVRTLLRRSLKRRLDTPFISLKGFNSSTNSFQLRNRSLSTVQTTFVEHNVRRESSMLSTSGGSSHFGSRYTIRGANTNSRAMEGNNVNPGDSNYSLSLISKSNRKFGDEDLTEGVEEVNRHYPQTNKLTSDHKDFLTSLDNSLSFIDDDTHHIVTHHANEVEEFPFTDLNLRSETLDSSDPLNHFTNKSSRANLVKNSHSTDDDVF